MVDHLAPVGIGLANVLSWPNILIPILGTVLAMVASFLPGVGGASLAAIMVVVTLNWDPVSVLLLFGALTGGATFMGSVTAILFNIPGNTSSAAALIDGHPMARAGRARTAIACAAAASAAGSLVGVAVLIALLPFLQPILLQFGPFERALLALWGLTTIVAVLDGSPLRAVVVSLLGLLLAMVGSDPVTSQPRWTFGSYQLSDGLSHIAMLLGFFTLAEIISWRRSQELQGGLLSNAAGDSTMAGIRSVLTHWPLTLRSGLIGTVVGIIPGVGGAVAGFIAYGQAVLTAKGDRSGFGKGDIRGLIGPEAAIDSKDGGSLVPVLAFGLPGSRGGVILLTVLAIHGLVPGTPMLTTELSFTYTLIFALLLSNLLTSGVGLALAPALARLGRVRIDRIALPVLVISLVSILQINGMLVDLHVAVAFAVLGYLLRQYGWPRIPFVIAFVLGGFLESNLALSIQLYEVGRLAPFERPAALVIMALIGLSLVWMLYRSAIRATPAPARVSETGLMLGLLAFLLLLAAESFSGAPGYSLYARMVVIAALLLLLGMTLVGLRARATRLTPADGREPVIPAAHCLPLALVASCPVAVLVFGLPVALGGLVAVWLMAGSRPAPGRVLAAGAAAVATGAATALYLARVATFDLPVPLVAGLLGL